MNQLAVTVTENPAGVGWRWLRPPGPYAVGVYIDTTDTSDEPQAWPYLPRLLFRHRAVGLWTKWVCVAVTAARYAHEDIA